MPLSKEHKTQTRARIVERAGSLFRREGYASVGIDRLMASAELTRGGFYAHFESKEDLLQTIVAEDHGLIRMLRRREGNAKALHRQATKILRDYLEPSHFEEILPSCTFASLTGDVARASAEVRTHFAAAYTEAAGELLRRGDESAAEAWSNASHQERNLAIEILRHAFGAMNLAAALRTSDLANTVLQQAWRDCERLLATRLHLMNASTNSNKPAKRG